MLNKLEREITTGDGLRFHIACLSGLRKIPKKGYSDHSLIPNQKVLDLYVYYCFVGTIPYICLPVASLQMYVFLKLIKIIIYYHTIICRMNEECPKKRDILLPITNSDEVFEELPKKTKIFLF